MIDASLAAHSCGRRAASSPLPARVASAQQPTSAQASAIRSACRADYQANCAGVPTGGEAALACLQQNAAQTVAGVPAGAAPR